MCKNEASCGLSDSMLSPSAVVRGPPAAVLALARCSAGQGRRPSDLPLEDLARRPFRQLVGEPDMARVLICRDARLDPRTQIVGVACCARGEDDSRPDLLAERL